MLQLLTAYLSSCLMGSKTYAGCTALQLPCTAMQTYGTDNPVAQQLHATRGLVIVAQL